MLDLQLNMEEGEDIELSLEELMLAAEKDVLHKLMSEIGIHEELFKDKSKMFCMKTIRKQLDDKETDSVEAKVVLMKECIDSLETKMGRKKDTITPKETSLEETAVGDGKNKNKNIAQDILATSILRKEFRIIGQVDSSQKDKLTYISLVRQIEDGKAKGYDDKEIIGGVLKAIVPRSLRSYLEMINDLGINRLCQILRVHYQEKSATELYQSLIGMKQEREETASQFLMRALETREKIVFAARGDEEGEQYSKEIVQSLFLKTLESGIEEGISSRIRPMLTKTVNDVELIQEVAMAESVHKMRMQKEKSQCKQPKVSAVCSTEESKLVTMMVEMQKQLSSMNEEITTLKESKKEKGYAPNIRKMMCEKCKSENQSYCNHCVKCGKSGHLARNCSLNSTGHS